MKDKGVNGKPCDSTEVYYRRIFKQPPRCDGKKTFFAWMCSSSPSAHQMSVECVFEKDYVELPIKLAKRPNKVDSFVVVYQPVVALGPLTFQEWVEMDCRTDADE